MTPFQLSIIGQWDSSNTTMGAQGPARGGWGNYVFWRMMGVMPSSRSEKWPGGRFSTGPYSEGLVAGGVRGRVGGSQ